MICFYSNLFIHNLIIINCLNLQLITLSTTSFNLLLETEFENNLYCLCNICIIQKNFASVQKEQHILVMEDGHHYNTYT